MWLLHCEFFCRKDRRRNNDMKLIIPKYDKRDSTGIVTWLLLLKRKLKRKEPSFLYVIIYAVDYCLLIYSLT